MLIPPKQVSPGDTGISDFTDHEAQQIAHTAETKSWQVAAHDYMRGTNHRAYRLAIDEYRSQMRFLLPLERRSSVLNVQADWGAVAFNLATHVALVVAMDARVTRSRFVSARRMQSTVESVHPLCGESSYLPFADDTFDAVIIADAMEINLGNVSASQLPQPTVLAEAKRVLKNGGWALLGVANRLGIARPATPCHRPSHSYWGYQRLLKKARFRNARFYASLPSHREPFFIFPAERTQLFGYFLDQILTAQDYRSKLEARGLSLVYHATHRLQWAAQQLCLTACARYFVPSYLIVAQK